MTIIGASAFRDCIALSTVIIPNSVKRISKDSFNGCSGLTSITIGNSLTSLENRLFSGCSVLTNINIPESVTQIQEAVFKGCVNLLNITIPNSVTSIGGSAFSGCSGLASVNIPNSVTYIGSSAFSGCSGLTSITIGNSVENIGSSSFASCPALTDVSCFATNMPNTTSDAFKDSYAKYITLHVTAESINEYKKTAPWSGFKDVVPIEEVTLEKCTSPTIAYANGEFIFSCETEGVEYVYDVKVNGAKTGSTDSKVKVSPTLTVSVYATKEGYENSDMATKTIDLLSLSGDVSGDGVVDATDLTKLIDILLKRQ